MGMNEESVVQTGGEVEQSLQQVSHLTVQDPSLLVGSSCWEDVCFWKSHSVAVAAAAVANRWVALLGSPSYGSAFQAAMMWIHCLTNVPAEDYSSTYYSKFLLLYDRKIRCIQESGTETCSTEAEYESSSSKMTATRVYLSFQHVSSWDRHFICWNRFLLCYQLL